MKISSFYLATFLCAAFLTGCGGCNKKKSDTETIDTKNPLSVLGGLAKMGEKAKEEVMEVEKRMEERRKRGDTLAMHYKELQKYLPTSVSGYEKDGDPTGETQNMMGFSISLCRQSFKKGDDRIEVSLSDYAQGYGAFQTFFATAGMFSLDNDEEKRNKFDIGTPYTTAIESYMKKQKTADVTVGTGYRFMITVRGTNQPDAEFVKKVAQSMNLKELSEK